MLLKDTFRMHMATVCPAGFAATSAALLVFNYLLAELPLFAVANRFEFLCQSKAADAIQIHLSFFSKVEFNLYKLTRASIRFMPAY